MTVSLPRRAILGPEDRAILRQIPVQQVTFTEAAAVTELHPDILRQLVRFGVLPGVVAGEHGTVDIDRAAQLAAQLAAARANVEGLPIGPSAAAEKYGFHRGTIYNWVKDQWVRVLVNEPRVLVNEGDVAFARALADVQGQAAGKAVFPSKARPGRPRKPKN